MGTYSIKELEQLSGIKAHTIRIWEKRHQLIRPKRTKTNIRFYSDDDLKKIINISALNARGVKISKIVGLSDEEINREVIQLADRNEGVGIYIDQLIVAMIDLEEEQFNQQLLSITLKFGFEKAILEIIYPFLEKIGVLWQTNNITPAQEHFISHLIRQKMMVAIDALPLASKPSPTAVLFLPENELHEMSLLFYSYIAKKQGLRTYYLGQTVPYASLKSICNQYQPDFIITSITVTSPAKALQNYIEKLCSDFPGSTILASGHAVLKSSIEKPANLKTFDNALSLSKILQE